MIIDACKIPTQTVLTEVECWTDVTLRHTHTLSKSELILLLDKLLILAITQADAAEMQISNKLDYPE